jgi:hypothetical protein
MNAQNEQLEPGGQARAPGGKSILGGSRGGFWGGFWRRGLLLTTSAALGGIAVAIWNRRSLARMRQGSEAGTARPARDEKDTFE